jgi:hypothetical protein
LVKQTLNVPTLTAKQIAKKWNLSLDTVKRLISDGEKVEKEHTTDISKANEIARDHIGERPDYYKKLHRLEKSKISMKEGISSGPEREVPIIGDLTGSSRKVMKVDEIKLPPKVKKAVATGITLANIGTLAQVAGDAAEGRKDVDPKRSVVAAASTLPGAPGWAATGVNYTIKGFDKVKEHIRKKQNIKEDLRKWFREKWVRYDTKGNIKGPCAREEGEGKPKCRPLASAKSMSKDERAKSARRKRREDPVADRSGKGGKPVMVRTEDTLLEKNVPTNPELWARAKAQAKSKFDVYPSAYANGWASKWYKSKGGGWKSAANESIEEACWDTHKQEGMKKKGNRMVPNCVPKEETDAADETNMARTQLKAMSSKANNLQSKLKSPKNLPGWVQSKIAVAKDGITAVDDYMTHSDKINEISAELVGKVSNARFRRGEAPSKTLTRAINKKFIEAGEKKENVKKQTVKEELMDTKEQIHEAIGNIMDENLHEMKENFLAVLQEKAIEKLEERKKEIAAKYFAQD